MADLLALLGLGSAGLAAQHTGAAVASNNAANVNSPGYSRQRVDLRAQLASPLVGGVRSGAPTRMASELLEGRARTAHGTHGASDTEATALKDLEARLNAAGSLDGDLAELWANLARVSATPTDGFVRQAAINSVHELAGSVQRAAVEVGQARTEADARIRDTSAQANGLIREIAAANRALVISDDPVLRDRRDAAAVQLAALVGGSGRVDPDGQLRWVLPDGAVLVDGDRAAQLTTTVDPATGFRRVEVVDGAVRRDVTASLTGGSLGGDLAFRDVDAAAVAADLDQFAFDLATNLNATHRANAGTDGVTGRNMFTQPTAVSGAAAALVVDPGLLADPAQLATVTPGSGPGDNGGALALLALQDELLGNGATATLADAAIEISASLGLRTLDTEAAAKQHLDMVEYVSGLRDSLSGVDLEEELTKLVQFQHASEAMTRFLSTIDGMLGDLLDRL